MDWVMGGLSAPGFAVCMAITAFAGLVKGAVGFAMPMIMISAMSSFLPPDMALAALIMPTLLTNFLQAFRQGFGAFRATVMDWRRYLMITVVALVRTVEGVVRTIDTIVGRCVSMV